MSKALSSLRFLSWPGYGFVSAGTLLKRHHPRKSNGYNNSEEKESLQINIKTFVTN